VCSAHSDGTYCQAGFSVAQDGGARVLMGASAGSAQAKAQSGSTPQWQGIVGVQAADAQGQNVALLDCSHTLSAPPSA
jgi:hypothetical protein